MPLADGPRAITGIAIGLVVPNIPVDPALARLPDPDDTVRRHLLPAGSRACDSTNVPSDPAFPDPLNALALAPDCRRCPTLVDDRTTIAWGNGALDARLVIVGEAPGAGEPDADRWRGGNWTGMAYTARHSGRRIRSTLAAIGYGPEATYYTNAVKCYPADGTGSNRAPTASERASCRPFLLAEIDAVAPDAVLATGRHATASLLAAEGRDLDGFLDVVLTTLACPTVGVPVVPVLHPSYREVWLDRLGHTLASYRVALRETLAELR